MLVINDSEAKFGVVVGRVPPRPLSATCIAKLTLRLVPGGVAEFLPLDEHLDLDGDQPWDGDPTLGLRAPSDFALFKPNADLLFAATGFAPGGKPVTQLEVGVAVDQWTKSLLLVGDRFWKPKLFGTTVSEAMPFTKMPVTWSRAYGGPGFKKNPVGRGRAESVLPDGTKVRLAPNVMDPRHPVHAPDDGIDPAGWGPVDAAWPLRASKVGTYDAAWLKKHWPWFPEDFDWSYFNSAPPDQQVTGRYLSGAERLSFRHLHPKHAELQCALPGVRVRCFVHVRNGNALEFREVPMELDTLFADPEAERVVLTWRGVTTATTYKMKEIEEAFLFREPLRSPLARSLEEYRSLCLRRKEETLAEGEFEVAPLDPPVIPPPEVPDTSWSERLDKRIEADRAKKPYEPSQDPAWLKATGPNRPTVPKPPLPAQTPTLAEAQEMMQKSWVQLSAAEPGLVKAAGGPPELSALIAAEKEFDAAIAAVPEKPPLDPEKPDWTRASVESHLKGGGHFEREDLSALDLSKLDFRGRNLQGAVLQGAKLAACRFDGANLTGANLSETDLTGAVLDRANLTETDLAKAKGPGASFVEATLEFTDASEAKFPQAKFLRARGKQGTFAGADLTGAAFDSSEMVQPDFTGAILAEATFRRARLPDAGFYDVDGGGADFGEADLPKARFSKAMLAGAKFLGTRAPETVWDECVLESAQFGRAELSTAIFSEANVEKADFTLATLPNAKFDDAQARGAKFVGANLFRATIEGADVRTAAFGGSNLFEVEFFRAQTEGADFTGANLKRTKLA